MENEWRTGMPPEHDSVFAKAKGTPKWIDGIMWEKESDNVLVTREYSDGQRIVCPDQTLDGEWKASRNSVVLDKCIVVGWMPYPEPMKK